MYIMYRYLINLSYIGTPFRGMQRQITYKDRKVVDLFTVQGQIDIGLRGLNPCNEPQTILSSRTDAGVHAFHSTVHTDLERPSGSHYQPRTITLCLNNYFTKNKLPIRIIKTYLVPNDFNCRFNAISRTYLYRLCVIKTNCDSVSIARGLSHIPIEETDRCLFLCTDDTFDVDKMKEAAKLFLGLHDFRTFMGKGSSNPEKVTRRVIDKLDITEACPAVFSPYSWPQCMANDKSDYKFFDIYVKASGFLYNQVRRTVASLIAVAQGKVTPKDIKFMLEIPSHHSWDPSIKTVPAHGLYLCRVEYARSDLERFKERLD